MSIRYKYKDQNEILIDRGLDSHNALRKVYDDPILFGQIVRNIIRHAFESGRQSAGGEARNIKYE